MKKIILGVDLGQSSLGWALLTANENSEPEDVQVSGVRVFPAPVEDKSKEPKNKARRAARGARKIVSRRKMRMQHLTSILTKHGLLPTDKTQWEQIFSDHAINPYVLRKKALDEKLALHEIGRCLYHICRRRGFKSNRKAALAELLREDSEIVKILEQEEQEKIKSGKISKSDEEGIILKAISQLQQNINEAKARTLGEYLAMQLENKQKVRCLHTSRAMYEQEFEAIWESQRQYYPQILVDSIKAQIYSAIFHQRPLKIQKFLIGRCEFEPTRKRAMKGLTISQDFIIWQDLNNIRLKDLTTRTERPLTPEEKTKIYEILQEQESLSWSSFRTKLKLPKDKNLMAINLEEGGKQKLTGNITRIKLQKALPNKWPLDETTEREIVTDILTISRKDSLIRSLKRRYGLTTKEAYEVSKIEPPPGTMNLSAKAICKVLKYLKQGLNYHDAFQAAGYKRTDQKEQTIHHILPEPPDARNPVVNKAMRELRKVVNAIVRRFGKPDIIRVEMARDMKLSKKQKQELQKSIKQNEKLNKEAEQELRKLGIQNPTREDKLKYRLWKECCGTCPYTGQKITPEMLVSEDVDIEHIIPYTRCLDDSFKNKTLCMATENRMVKRNQTPFEAYSSNPEKYQEILARVRDMPDMHRRKKRLFELENLSEFDDFVSRQLNDTRYICRLAKDFLALLVGHENVQLIKGEATAALRYKWGLNSLLGDDDNEGKYRDDHRHHAIDAIVIACISRGLFQKLSRLTAKGGSLSLRNQISGEKISLPEPWQGFRNAVEQQIKSIIVSHAPTRKISGALHEDTAYGLITHPKTKNRVFAYRKPLNGDLTRGEIERIIDDKIRTLVQERVKQHNENIKEALGNENNPILITNKYGKQQPVKRVRLFDNKKLDSLLGVKDENGNTYKYHPYGNNHHVEIIECTNEHTDEDGKKWKVGDRKGIFVTTYEAAKRARLLKVPIVQKDHGDNWKFVMSLCANDMMEIEENGNKEYYRVQKLAATNNVVVLRKHETAIVDERDAATVLRKTPNTLKGVKVEIDPLGNISPSYD